MFPHQPLFVSLQQLWRQKTQLVMLPRNQTVQKPLSWCHYGVRKRAESYKVLALPYILNKQHPTKILFVN